MADSRSGKTFRGRGSGMIDDETGETWSAVFYGEDLDEFGGDFR
jgi:hypothetical protein